MTAERAAVCGSAFLLLVACSYDFERFVSEDSRTNAGGMPTDAGGMPSGGRPSTGGRSETVSGAGEGSENPDSVQGGNAVARGGSASTGGSVPNGSFAEGGTSAMGSGGRSDGSTTQGAVNSGGAATGGTVTAGTDASGGTASSAGQTSTSGGNEPECAGKRVLDVCWYLGKFDESCTQVCESHGGVADAALVVIGVSEQGGSAAECRQVLDAFEQGGALSQGTRTDGLGLGCFLRVERNDRTTRWWLSAPAYDVDAHHTTARRACGCAR
ncbi:MAG TPA: hypothetical protein VFQ61_01420 [Polyangiaceae bacterium]|nr:hypothetical protein [Polyangiaceae bacterium]